MNLNPDLIHFLMVVVFSFLVGLEVKSYRVQFHPRKEEKYFFGSTRTYTFVGILGFILYKIDSTYFSVYIAGLLAITILYALLYYRNLLDNERSILLYVVMLLVYTFGAIAITQPLWMPALLYVLIVFILNAKDFLGKLIDNLNTNEYETLGKMVLLSAVILPLLPDTKVIPYVPLSPFKIWMAVVVISGISYGGYVVQKYFFPSKGYFLIGLFGGSYSSTATTVVLARKAKEIGNLKVIDAAMISATSMMYLRLIIVALIFNITVGKTLLLPFLFLSIVGFIVSFFYLKSNEIVHQHADIVDNNPLEMRTAFLFAFLFVAMMVLTQFITQKYGTSGLVILSFLVGFSDIDPFILSVLTSTLSITDENIIAAIMIAAGSNNLLKAAYALWFGGIKNTYRSAIWIAVLGVCTIVWGLFYEGLIAI